MRRGRPLVGVSGELNWQLALRYGGVVRAGAYCTNWRKTAITDEEKKGLHERPEEVQEWNDSLEHELQEKLAPGATVVALGAWSTRALLGEEYNLYWANGLPIRRPDGMTVVPVVNAAAGLHDSGMLVRTAQGYEGLRAWLDAKQPAWPQNVWRPNPRVRRGTDWPAGAAEVAIDTEGSKSKPFMLQFAFNTEESWILYAEERAEIALFRDYLRLWKPRLVLHNALHDADVLLALGIDIWEYEVVDTMILSYNLQNLPRDLKNLARALLGVRMEEYQEVVGPYQRAADADWLDRTYQAAVVQTSMEQQFTPKGKPRLAAGAPVFKRTGPELQMRVVKHIERQQQLSDPEQLWAEKTVGPRPRWELSLVPPPLAEAYAGKDSTSTLGNLQILEPMVERANLTAVAALDNAVLPLVSDMMRCGMHLDLERYWQVQGEISTRRQEVVQEIRGIVMTSGHDLGLPPEEFNPGSPDQIEAFCTAEARKTGRLRLTKKTRKKTRLSTAGDILEQIRGQHEIIPAILEYRELATYEDRYLLPMQKLIQQVPGRDEYRLYVKLNPATVVSGRYSSGGRDLDTGDQTANALAWPSHSKLGMRLRWIFTAPKGMVMASWDLSQIELRLAAALSGEPVMIEAFQKGLDLHSNLAARLFGVSYDTANEGEGKQLYRLPAKTVHYLMVYGGSAYTLYEVMGGKIPMEQCEQMISDTWALYRRLDAFIRASGEEARMTGEVRDFLGRRRFLPGSRLVGDDFDRLRAEADRQGWNFKAQGGAAELLKRSMDTVQKVVYPRCRAEGIHFRLWLQVHDELMGELDGDDGAWEKVNAWMTEAMQQDGWLTDPVPIITEGERGQAWSDLK